MPPLVVVELDVASFIPWVLGIARGVRSDYRFAAGSQEESELEGCALEQLVILTQRFDESRLKDGDDPDALFRAMAAPWVRKACKREAERLRNGGLYRTAAKARVKIGPLPTAMGDGEVLLTAREPDEEPDEPEPIRCRHEPRLVLLRNGKPVTGAR